MSHFSIHRRLFYFFSLLLIFCLGVTLAVVSPRSNTGSRQQYHAGLLSCIEDASGFKEYTDALFAYEVTSDSVTTTYTLKNPSLYQIPALEPSLTSFSASSYEKSVAKNSTIKLNKLLSDSLSRFDPATLSRQEQITYSLLQHDLTLNANLANFPYYEMLLGSSSGIQASLPVTLGEYPLRTETDITTYLSLLTQVPAYFEDAISYENTRHTLGYHTPDFILADAKDKLATMLHGFQQDDNSFIDTFDKRIAEIDGLSKHKQSAYKKKNAAYVKKYILPAYENLYTYIENYLQSNSNTNAKSTTKKNIAKSSYAPEENTSYGLSSLPDGTTYYSLLVQSATGSSRPMEELIEKTDTALSNALGDVLNIALTDSKAYLYYCENPLETYYQSPEAILEALSLMMRKDYPALTTTPTYNIKMVSDSLASSLSPAFYMIPAMDDYSNNTIYINPLYTNAENGNLFTTLAHEGFPGHLYQTVYFNSNKPDRIRQVLDYPGYVEGWATYVEMNSFHYIDYPLEGDNLCRLYQADTIINLALCSRIDLGVNFEGWSLADTKAFFEKNGFKDYYAEQVYTYVVESPANYLSYFIGYLEIMDLKSAYKKQEMEHYSEQQFHKEFLDIGPADYDTVRRCIFVLPD